MKDSHICSKKRSKRKDKKLWIEQGEYERFKEMVP